MKRGLRHAASDRRHAIEKIVLKSAGLKRQPTDGQIDEMAATAAQLLKPLLGIALSGNLRAILKVTELASHLCTETTTLACMHQKAANIVARERTTWPLNISHDPKERNRTLRLVTGPRSLPLGNPPRPPAVAKKKASGFSNPASAAVLVALKAIEIERSFRIPSELFPPLQPKWSAAAASLPDLQPSTADAWFNVLWMYICDRHAGAPEKSELRRLVAAADALPSAAEPNVRAALRKTLKAAFLRLARGRRHARRRG